MVRILAAVTMLSAGLVAVPTTMEQATAQNTEFIFEQVQENICDDPICVSDDNIDFVWSVEIHY
jgi:hypothetical protein